MYIYHIHFMAAKYDGRNSLFADVSVIFFDFNPVLFLFLCYYLCISLSMCFPFSNFAKTPCLFSQFPFLILLSPEVSLFSLNSFHLIGDYFHL